MGDLEKIYSVLKKSSGVYTDSRNTLQNGLFFALTGEKFNGNDFALEAINAGKAIGAVIDNPKLREKSNKFIYVKDTLKTLQNLASFHRQRLKCPVFSITGSNGKTTTKELLKKILNTKYKTYSTIGNLNNHIGVPLTILNTPISAEFLIIEMGANHLNEIKKLCEIAKPSHGFITNFGLAHLKGFGGKEGVIKGKSELYDFLDLSGGKIFVNYDNKDQIKQLGDKKYISFGKGLKANFKIEYNYENKDNLELYFKGHKFLSSLYGDYNYPNISAALAVGYFFDVPIQQMQSSIKSYKSMKNRSQLININDKKIILDAYNANPTSMDCAIKNFEMRFPNDNLIIIGDMLELGKYTKTAHQKIVDLTKTLSLKKVITVGKNFFEINKTPNHFIKFYSTDELINYLRSKKINEKHILIKGSRSLALEKLINIL